MSLMLLYPVSDSGENHILLSQGEENSNDKNMTCIVLVHQMHFYRKHFAINMVFAGIMKMKLS